MAALYPLLAKLAEKIEERVALITNPSSSRYSVAGSAVLSKLDIGGGKTQNAQDHSKTSNQISSTPTTDDILVDKGTVKAVLLSCIATTTKTTTTLLKAFIDLSHALDQEASVSGNSNLYVLQDGTNRTRFNFISSTYILMFVFETILSFSSKYISGDFVQSSIIDKLAIKLDTRVNSSFSASILTLQKNTTDSTNLIPDSIKVNKNDGIVISDVPIIGKSSKQTNSLETLQTKLVEEDVAVKNILHILDVIGRKLTQSSRQAVSYFTTANQARGNLTTSNKNPLELSQLKVSSWILDNYLEWQQQSEGGFATSKSLSLGERNAMFSLLKDTPYTDEEEKIKLLVVGIPAGFTDKLTNRVKRAEINRNTFTNENTDLVNICVYRKSEEYDDIVFKPQKFMFDLSLFFSTPTNLDVKIEQPFEAVLKQIQLERFNSPQKELLSREEMLKRTEYSFLTQKEKETLFKNHVVSGLLETYSVLSTGLRFTEDGFMIEDLDPDSGVANPDVENLIRRYFQEIKGQTLTGGGLLELLSNPEVSEELKDEIRILAYGNNFFKSGIVESKILNQKLFDRVLILPLEMNNFEIDKDSTFSTDSGRKSYNTPKIQKLIKQTGDSEYISRQPNSIIFDNFFVSIETTR
jgi:hypothetical protein